VLFGREHPNMMWIKVFVGSHCHKYTLGFFCNHNLITNVALGIFMTMRANRGLYSRQVTNNQRLFIVSSVLNRIMNKKAKLSSFIILCNTRETIKKGLIIWLPRRHWISSKISRNDIIWSFAKNVRMMSGNDVFYMFSANIKKKYIHHHSDVLQTLKNIRKWHFFHVLANI